MKVEVEIGDELFHDALNIASGLFYPLKGFMTNTDYRSVVDSMCLCAGDVWTIPITFDIDHEHYLKASHSNRIYLSYMKQGIGFIDVENIYTIDNPVEDVQKVFKTIDLNHPGVKKELSRSVYRIGGEITLKDDVYPEGFVTPDHIKGIFRKRGWKTIVGFQTRNPIHKAHEYLQRVGIEVCDGLFINPLVGWKKSGDFSEEAVVSGYSAMLENYYNRDRIFFAVLRTPMRYAGPKEAIFHAIIRRNMGCSHFIIGRDHAGVGGYYGEYEAHELARSLLKDKDLGIELLLLNEPYYCTKCEQIVTSKSCGHGEQYQEKINGTNIRSMLARGIRPEEKYMRAEVADAIIALGDRKFIVED